MGTNLKQTVQTATVDCTVFSVGDTVRGADGRLGQIINPFGQQPSAVPVASPTSNVMVKWIDNTFSTVALSTLSKP
jgi:hypothetical protein